jgi:hypothetical protein
LGSPQKTQPFLGGQGLQRPQEENYEQTIAKKSDEKKGGMLLEDPSILQQTWYHFYAFVHKENSGRSVVSYCVYETIRKIGDDEWIFFNLRRYWKRRDCMQKMQDVIKKMTREIRRDTSHL